MSEESLLPAILFTTLALALLAGATLVVLIAAHQQRVRQRVALAEADAQYQLQLRQVSTELQEQLLARLSEDLHSDIGQRLTLIHLQLQSCEAAAAGTLPLLAAASANLIDAMKQVRQLSHALSPEVVTDRGLAAMVRHEVRRLQQNSSPAVQLQEDDTAPPVLTPDQQLIAFRIFQEAVNNALRHARASRLHIRLQASPFLLEVRDDGVGFEPHALPPGSRGAGLPHMQRRAALAGLRWALTSTPGRGTACRIQAPA